MTGFFEEVQRRKVYRIATTYILIAGFIGIREHYDIAQSAASMSAHGRRAV